MSAKENVAKVKEAYEAFKQGNIQEFCDLSVAEAEYVDPFIFVFLPGFFDTRTIVKAGYNQITLRDKIVRLKSNTSSLVARDSKNFATSERPLK